MATENFALSATVIMYLIVFFITSILVTKRLFNKDLDSPVIIIPVTVMSAIWPIFWLLTAYGEFKA